MKKTTLSLFVLVICLCVFVQCNNIPKECFILECNEQGAITNFVENTSKMKWKPSSFPLFDIGKGEGISPSLSVESVDNGCYRLLLVLTNNGNDSVWVEPRFPVLKDWEITEVESDEIYQLFPRQGEMANNTDSISYAEVYSGNFPFQFIDVYRIGHGGIMLQTLDDSNYPKKYYLDRNKNILSMGVIYRAKMLAPGESWSLPSAELSVHQGDWHAAFTQYRNWLKNTLRPITARKDWFRDVYNFRQTFLYDNSGETGAHDLKTSKVDLIAKVNESVNAFGGVDYLHLFDWGQTPDQGRCGDYFPWHYLNKKELQSQVKKVKASGIPVGLYHEGYLLSPTSKVCKEHGTDWQMLDAKSNRYARFGDGYYYPCPLVEEWREYIANTVKRSSEEVGADGVYIDQFGFGWQYGCYNPSHGHDVHHTSVNSEMQVFAEAGLMNHIKRKISANIVTYTEECPTDISTQYQDGSFSYAICTGRDSVRHNPAVVNLNRFAFPDYKLFEILHIDDPIGHDTIGIKHVFFNGEGLWLSGPLSNPKWFPEDVRATIRKCYSILSTHKEAFRSMEPEPLIETRQPFIYANYFPSEKECVWTLFNASNSIYEGDVLEIEAMEGTRFYDAWNDRIIEPKFKNGKAMIQMKLLPKDVGCVIQIL